MTATITSADLPANQAGLAGRQPRERAHRAARSPDAAHSGSRESPIAADRPARRSDRLNWQRPALQALDPTAGAARVGDGGSSASRLGSPVAQWSNRRPWRGGSLPRVDWRARHSQLAAFCGQPAWNGAEHSPVRHGRSAYRRLEHRRGAGRGHRPAGRHRGRADVHTARPASISVTGFVVRPIDGTEVPTLGVAFRHGAAVA